MKKLRRICRAPCYAAAIAGGLVAPLVAQEENLVGTWNCSLSYEDPQAGASMSAVFEQTYAADGTYERAGDFRVMVPLLEIDTTISMVEAGTWRLLDATVLAELSTELEFSSVKEAPSVTEQMMLQQMQSEADAASEIEQSVELTELTATTMEFEDEDGVLSTCQKA